MDDDALLQQNVQDELRWRPEIDPAHIGITAEGGVVTLTGHVRSYAEKRAVEDAVKRVIGVRGIAETWRKVTQTRTMRLRSGRSQRSAGMRSCQLRVFASVWSAVACSSRGPCAGSTRGVRRRTQYVAYPVLSA